MIYGASHFYLLVKMQLDVKLKYKADDSTDRYKACLVARGFLQVEGMNFYETFSPFAKVESICTILAIATVKDCKVHQMDVKTIFLNRDLVE